MGTERDTRLICECLCGKGSVMEHLWANDHPFASDYSWHSEGNRLHCEQCEGEWEITHAVSNPVTAPPGQQVIYFVAKPEYKTVSAHNSEIERSSSGLWSQKYALGQTLQKKLAATRSEVLSQLAATSSKFEERFRVVGPICGINDIDAFRECVGRTQPKTYIPQLVTGKNLSAVLDRMGNSAEADEVRKLETEEANLEQKVQEIRSAKRLPKASEHRFAQAGR